MGNICNSLCPPDMAEQVEQAEQRDDRNKLGVPTRPQASLKDVRESFVSINNVTGPEVEVDCIDRDTIKPAPIDEEAKGIFDYTAFVDIE